MSEIDVLNSLRQIEDIEDAFIGTDDIMRLPKRAIFPRRTGSFNRKSTTIQTDVDKPVVQSFVPGMCKVYVKTWGCSHNSSDGEYMAGQLAAHGYPITQDSVEADLWILNSCTVKSPAEDHFKNEIKKAQTLGKYIIVAGCVPQGQPRAQFLQGLSVIGVQQIDRILEVVEETLKGNSVRLLSQRKVNGKKAGGASLALPKVRRNPLIEIIPINTGCLNQCTYCKTKHARGDLGSYPIEEIVARAQQAFTEGVVEIWLTSEDLGAYGRDIGVTLPQLLWRLVDVIPDYAMMRLGMTNPPYILEHLHQMSQILSHPRIYSFLHVPVQSASDAVLSDMKREYCCGDFQHVVDFLKERIPGMTIATDIICGFPTETDQDFQETLDLIAKNKFPSLFINQFFARPGTPAARMDRIPAQDIKKRTKLATSLFHSYQPYGHKVGETQDVLVTEISHDKRFYVGHNKFYEQVLVPKDEKLLGKMVTVTITAAGKHHMIGQYGKPRSRLSCHPLTWCKNQLVGSHLTDIKGLSSHVIVLFVVIFLYFIGKYSGFL